jgi:hypothetical protein
MHMKTNHEDREVFPPGMFRDTPPITTESEVEECLTAFYVDRLDFQYMTQWVLNELKCIFAILVLIDEVPVIDAFYDKIQSDNLLSMSQTQVEGVLKNHDRFRFSDLAKGIIGHGLRTTGHVADHFFSCQWSFLSPSLLNDFGHMNFPDEIISPFSRIEDFDEGSFSAYSVAYLISWEEMPDDLSYRIIPVPVPRESSDSELNAHVRLF